MTANRHGPVRRALDGHADFTAGEQTGDRQSAFGYEATPFDVTVETVAGEANDEAGPAIRVTVRVPTLDAVVTGETVAPVVEDGWYETFERRVAEAFDVTRAASDTETVVERGGRTVEVVFTYVAGDAERGVADAKALADYVEGTYVQGVIPGYDYEEPVAGLLARAADRAGADGNPT